MYVNYAQKGSENWRHHHSSNDIIMYFENVNLFSGFPWGGK